MACACTEVTSTAEGSFAAHGVEGYPTDAKTLFYISHITNSNDVFGAQ